MLDFIPLGLTNSLTYKPRATLEPCWALCAHNCVRHCALIIVCGIMRSYSIVPQLIAIGKTYRTHCQDECRSLSGGVPKNLTLHWMKKIFFSFYHQKEEIRSFPTMYNTWGCFLVRFGWKKWFIQKSTLKLGVFLDTVLDHLTSEAAGTHNFKDIANFHRCFEKSGT